MLRELAQQIKNKDGGLAYRPAITIQDRARWDQVDVQRRQYWIQRGETYLDYEWPPLTAALYAEYHQTGNRMGFEVPYHQRRQAVSALFLAECFDNQSRFVPALIEGLQLICDEPTWVVPAHYDDLTPSGAAPAFTTRPQDHVIDLFAAETGNLLAWVAYVCESRFSSCNPDVLQRLHQELQQRIMTPYLMHTDFWWMGYGEAPIGNWTPWCTSNCIGTSLLVEPDPTRCYQTVEKACFSLDQFINTYAEDGGCNEGPMYWNFAGACLFDSLEMLNEASHRAFDVFQHPIIKNIGTYIYKVHIHGLSFVNFADCPPKIPLDAALIYQYGKRIGDPHLQTLGIHLHGLLDQLDPEKNVRMKIYRFLMDLTDPPPDRSISPPLRLPRDTYLNNIQVMVSRECERPGTGFVMGVKGGHNQEEHNHNDVGNVIVYLDGQPVIIDAGMLQYTKQSFSTQRYDLWAMQSAYHNVPLINGTMQQNGLNFRAQHAHRYLSDKHAVTFSADIASAYPAEAGITTWERQCTFHRDPVAIHIQDAFCFDPEENRYELRYLTCQEPQINATGIHIEVQSGAIVTLYTTPPATRIELCPLPMDDPALLQIWGKTLYQLRLHFEAVSRQGQCTTTMTRLS